MKRMLLFLLFFGFACGQFRRFGDSFEDDSKENIFRRTSLNSANRFRDSDEVFFSNSGLRTTPNRINRFDDSNEVFFSGGTQRSSFPNSLNRFRNSNEGNLFGNTRRVPFRRFDDSKEIISRDRQGNFFVDSAEDFLRRARNRIDDSKEVFFGSNRNIPRTPTTFRSNSFRNNVNNRIRIDSVEDVFEDLFDDDLDDRLRAQNNLKRLQNNGFNFFRNGVTPQTNGVTNFQTRIGTNRFSSPSQGTNIGSFQSNLPANRNALNHFSIAQHSKKPASNRFNSGVTQNTNFNVNRNTQPRQTNVGVPLRSNLKTPGVPLRTNLNPQRSLNSSPTPSTSNFNNNPFSSNTNRRTGNTLNSISSSPFSATKRSSFTSPPGFNWPGGNGYYVSMSTGNSKPVTYFVKYDD